MTHLCNWVYISNFGRDKCIVNNEPLLQPSFCDQDQIRTTRPPQQLPIDILASSTRAPPPQPQTTRVQPQQPIVESTRPPIPVNPIETTRIQQRETTREPANDVNPIEPTRPIQPIDGTTRPPLTPQQTQQPQQQDDDVTRPPGV